VIEARVAPHDLDAEAAVLAAVLLEPAALDRVTELLTPDRMYSEAHRRILEAAIALSTTGTTPDLVSIVGWLRDRERLAQVGGAAYLAQLVDAVPSVANLESYALRVQLKWRQRQLIAACQKIAAEGYGDVGDITAWIDQAEQAIYEAAHVAEVVEEKSIAACATEAYESILAAKERGDRIVGVRTHLTHLDQILGGLREGKLTVLAAQPGVGKSMLAQSIALNIGRASGGLVGVQIFTPEMSSEEVGERSIASEAQLDSVEFRAEMSAQSWSRIASSIDAMGCYPVWVTDDATITTGRMRARIRRRQAQFNRYDKVGAPVAKVGLVILDYLQLLDTEMKKGETREQAVTRVTRELKCIAKSLRVHVIAISSLNRKLADRQDKRPIISDLRESGAIEFHADNILFLYRESFYDTKCDRPYEAEVNVAKQRGGPTGTVFLHFDKSQSRFEDARTYGNGSGNPAHWQETRA
jgi:replicative DNA helicase